MFLSSAFARKKGVMLMYSLLKPSTNYTTMEKKRFHIEKILIPFDFSETAELALEHGSFMAKLLKAEITLLHVVESYSFTSAISQAFSKTQSEFETKVE